MLGLVYLAGLYLRKLKLHFSGKYDASQYRHTHDVASNYPPLAAVPSRSTSSGRDPSRSGETGGARARNGTKPQRHDALRRPYSEAG